MTTVALTVNGRAASLAVEDRRLLSDALREDLGLTGTHVGCAHGVCGACTVLLDGEAARSCLLFASQLDGARVDTIEGLCADARFAALQQAFRRHHALQCGFCTPGMLVVAHDLLQGGAPLDEQAVRDGMSAAICRCTGYQGIVAAVLDARAAYAGNTSGAAA